MWSGAEGNRTPDLSIANAALSQLSYGPGILDLCVFKQRLSGADGTRTRDLRCDRPAL